LPYFSKRLQKKSNPTGPRSGGALKRNTKSPERAHNETLFSAVFGREEADDEEWFDFAHQPATRVSSHSRLCEQRGDDPEIQWSTREVFVETA